MTLAPKSPAVDFYAARMLRVTAARIVRHCKFERQCDPVYDVRAYLRNDAHLVRAARMLESRGLGKVSPSGDASGALVFRLN